MSGKYLRIVAIITEEVVMNVPRVLIASACLFVVSWAHSLMSSTMSYQIQSDLKK